jgi:hypothetical protein
MSRGCDTGANEAVSRNQAGEKDRAGPEHSAAGWKARGGLAGYQGQPGRPAPDGAAHAVAQGRRGHSFR